MATSEEPRAKTGCWEQKQGTPYAPCTQHHQKGGQTTSAQSLDTAIADPIWGIS